MLDMLGRFGVKSRWLAPNAVEIDTRGQHNAEAPYELVKTMRASIYVLGPLLARYGEARVSLPGGCAWGPRPVDLHIRGMEALGADVVIDHGYIVARSERLRGSNLSFDVSSVGATGNLLMAAATAGGRRSSRTQRCEPEITALAEFLIAMGARIEGLGSPRLVVTGVPELRPADTAMIPDRIEAGTLPRRGRHHRRRRRGHRHRPGAHRLDPRQVRDRGVLRRARRAFGPRRALPERPEALSVTTRPVSRIPDRHAGPIHGLLSVGNGVSTLVDTIYRDRFTHVAELQRLGADIRVDGNRALVHGVPSLSGAPVMATDLRASAALILAGLVAEGETRVSRVYHLDRGYERLEEKLSTLGADIRRARA